MEETGNISMRITRVSLQFHAATEYYVIDMCHVTE
jgi:hypothetical protein